MTGTEAQIVRVRELEVRYEAHRLHAPVSGSLKEAYGVTKLAEELLRDVTTDASIVLHLNRRLRLIGVHRLPRLIDRNASVADILRAALLSGATALIYVHRRHTDDWWSHEQDEPHVLHVRQAARMLDIELRDAIVISSAPEQMSFYSFRDNQVL